VAAAACNKEIAESGGFAETKIWNASNGFHKRFFSQNLSILHKAFLKNDCFILCDIFSITGFLSLFFGPLFS